MKIENICVHPTTKYSSQYALGWDKDGARFHVWLDRETKEVTMELFKNPPLGTNLWGEGYFSTRHLDLHAKQNWLDFTEAFKFAEDNNLFQVEEARLKAELEAEDVKHQKAVRKRKLETAGPRLYEALQLILNETATIIDLKQIARKAIEEADKA